MTRPLSTTWGRQVGRVGSEEATELARRIVNGSERVHVGISGSGGAGKSSLLDLLAESLRAEGVEVVRSIDEVDRHSGSLAQVALVIDDAERLPDDELNELAGYTRHDGLHVIAAFRPWPRSDAMNELTDQLGKQGRLLMLRQLTAAQVEGRAAEFLGMDLDDGLVDRLMELTGGNPRFVDLLLAAARAEDWDIRESTELPASVIERIREELEGVDRQLHEFLLALAIGFEASGPVLATAPRFARADGHDLTAAARATGLLSPDGSLLPVARAAMLKTTPEHELWALRRELIDAVEAAHLPLGDTAIDLASQGHRDERIADAVRSRADAELLTDPAEASRLYALAIGAGADHAEIAGRRAQAAWGAGDVRAAERLVDGMLSREDRSDLPRLSNVAAAIWARKGMLGRSAEAQLRSAADDDETAPLAAVCLAGIGDVEQARRIMESAEESGYPTSSQVALVLMAQGILSALDGASEQSLAQLLQASSVLSESGEIIPLPETPAVLAAQVALNAGELGIANGVLQSAIDQAEGGPAFEVRLLLMQALVALRSDHPVRARSMLEAATSSSQPLGLRDELLAHAVQVGIARHTDDLASLIRAWNAARQGIARMPVDLYGLPALAELSIAAARLQETQLVDVHVAAAWKLLDRAGQPVAWATSLHWAAIQAGLLGNDREGVAMHTAALLDASAGCRVAGRLARASRTWTAALAGEVDVRTVERTVRELAASGYPWDAGRLAAHAAARAPEHRDTLQLLALARGLHPDESRAEPTRDASGSARGAERDDRRLSGREREVARLVLEGKTYAEIGSAIFISPRTAEHHIARIRRRLGVSTRSELLAELRLVLEADDIGA